MAIAWWVVILRGSTPFLCGTICWVTASFRHLPRKIIMNRPATICGIAGDIRQRSSENHMVQANEEIGSLNATPLRPLKAVMHKLLPGAASRKASALWHFRGQYGWALKTAIRQGRPEKLIYFGVSPGDDLLCTAITHELAGRKQKKIWMMSNYPELFDGNASVA